MPWQHGASDLPLGGPCIQVVTYVWVIADSAFDTLYIVVNSELVFVAIKHSLRQLIQQRQHLLVHVTRTKSHHDLSDQVSGVDDSDRQW